MQKTEPTTYYAQEYSISYAFGAITVDIYQKSLPDNLVRVASFGMTAPMLKKFIKDLELKQKILNQDNLINKKP